MQSACSSGLPKPDFKGRERARGGGDQTRPKIALPQVADRIACSDRVVRGRVELPTFRFSGWLPCRQPAPDSVLARRVISYSSGVQQPGHATAVLSRHPRTRWPAPFNHEQDRASSYGSAGRASRSSEHNRKPSNQLSNDRRRCRWTPAGTSGRRIADRTQCGSGSPSRYSQ